MNIIKQFKNYLHENDVQAGETLWRNLDKGLARPLGVIEADKARIIAFQKRLANLSQREILQLKAFIKSQIAFYSDEPELTSYSIEMHYQKWRQIYSQHLQCIDALPLKKS